jgi:gamma-glutamylcysteine synthetase
VGIPEKRFEDLEDYVRTISLLRPVYVERLGKPVVLSRYRTFEEYYRAGRAVGLDPDGREISFVPKRADIDLHTTCYWYCARISRYYTVENRCNDQQSPDDLVCIAALTLGLVSALPEAVEEISSYAWEDLRTAREEACRFALEGGDNPIALADLAERMLELAQLGLRRRERGEEQFLVPLEERLRERKCPADGAASLFKTGGIQALLLNRKL